MVNQPANDLLNLIKSGDKNAFDALFRTYYVRMRRYALHITANQAVAEDIVQDIFFNLWTKRALIENIRSFDAYLRTSVYNRSVSFLRENQRQNKNLSVENQSIELENLHLEILQYRRDILAEKELSEAINKAIETLPPQCKTVFKLSRNFGLKNAEIAEQLNISDKAVEKHITKALHLLRIELKDYLPLSLLYFLIR